jgi:hypothetical protein
MRKTKIAALSAVAALAFLSLTACDLSDKISEPFSDARRSSKSYEGPADVITMPDGFSNAATKCISPGMRYTSAYHGDALYGAIAVTADPSCK